MGAAPHTDAALGGSRSESAGNAGSDCIKWTDGNTRYYYWPEPKPVWRPEYPMMEYGPGRGGRGRLYWPYSKLERKAIRKARKKARRVVTWLKLRRFGIPPEGGWPEVEFVSAPAVADAATERERQRKAGV